MCCGKRTTCSNLRVSGSQINPNSQPTSRPYTNHVLGQFIKDSTYLVPLSLGHRTWWNRGQLGNSCREPLTVSRPSRGLREPSASAFSPESPRLSERPYPKTSRID